MISAEEAKNIVLNQQLTQKIEQINIEDSLGRILAENILADRAMPPFDRVTMDGIAINFKDIENGIDVWKVVKTQFAGEIACSISAPGECIEVMTGTVLPIGCDTVVRYEDLDEIISKSMERHFKLNVNQIKPGQNIHIKGSDKKEGDVVLHASQIIAPTDLAMLATVGKETLLVYQKISVAIITTGDELTSINVKPNDYQIRASNHMLIAAALSEMGIDPIKYIMNDNLKELQALLEKCLLHFDVIVLTGAVSKGKADFIPAILEKLKVNKLFHGVAQRPAKPFWFGKKSQCVVFAMPGNPVSAAVCTYVYLLPFIQKQLGIKTLQLKVNVTDEVSFKPPLTYFMQARVSQNEEGKLIAQAFAGNGSGDLTNLSEINAFVVLPQHEEKFNSRQLYDAYLTRNIIYLLSPP